MSGTQTQVNDLRDKLNRGEDVNWGQLLYDQYLRLFLLEELTLVLQA